MEVVDERMPPKVPPGCFALPSPDGEALIIDPRAELEPMCPVVAYLRDDIRVRTVGAYAPLDGPREMQFVRICVRGAEFHEFDRDTVTIVRIVNVQPQS